MKLHKESKGTIIVASLLFAVIAALAIYFLEMWSLLIIVPLLVIYGLVFWFFRVPNRDILRSYRKCDCTSRWESGDDKRS